MIALFAGFALAVPVSVAVGAAAQFDLANETPLEHTQFGPGVQLVVPVWIELAGNAWLRLTPLAEFASGEDRLTWQTTVGGVAYRIADDDHVSFHLASGLTLGPELRASLGGEPDFVLNADAGAVWVGTYHALDGETQVLFEPAQNDLENPNNVDPYAMALAPRVGLSVGVDARGAAPIRVELGWSNTWVPVAALRKSPQVLEAKREAYAYDVVRVALIFPFGPQRPADN